MKRKTFDLIETKADGEPGQFSALASVFGNVDHVGDRVMPGAFKKTLAEWRKSGDPIPVVLSHQWDNPMAHIGIADPRAVIETERGLLVQGTLDIADNETAKQVHRLMKRRSLKAFSFGYTVPDGGETLNEKDGANELTEVDLVEFGPTLKGANPEAQLEAVKSALDVEAPASVGVDAKMTVDGTVPVFDFTSTTTSTQAEAPDVEEPEVKAVEPEKAEPPLTGEALEKAIEESDRFQEVVAARVEERLKAEREQIAAEEPENLTPEKVENVESEKPAQPVKPAAKADPLKNEIDRLRLEIAVGKRL